MTSTDFLNKEHIDNLITNQTLSFIYFKNGIRIRGHLVNQDEACIFLKDRVQPIYKHRIETIVSETLFTRFQRSRKRFFQKHLKIRWLVICPEMSFSSF